MQSDTSAHAIMTEDLRGVLAVVVCVIASVHGISAIRPGLNETNVPGELLHASSVALLYCIPVIVHFARCSDRKNAATGNVDESTRSEVVTRCDLALIGPKTLATVKKPVARIMCMDDFV
jgi:hypothetical protein